MSWHGRGGKPDPYAKPAALGDVFGTWEVTAQAGTHPKYGLRVAVKCVHCGQVKVSQLAKLRSDDVRWHFGCSRPRRLLSDPQVSLPGCGR